MSYINRPVIYSIQQKLYIYQKHFSLLCVEVNEMICWHSICNFCQLNITGWPVSSQFRIPWFFPDFPWLFPWFKIDSGLIQTGNCYKPSLYLVNIRALKARGNIFKKLCYYASAEGASEFFFFREIIKITNKYYYEIPWKLSLIYNEIPWFFPDFPQKGRFSLTFPDLKTGLWNSLIFPDAGHPDIITIPCVKYW